MKNITNNRLILTIIILFFTCLNAYSITYYPLKVGNRFTFHYAWSYYSPSGGSSGSHDYLCKITKDTLINNKLYFHVENYLEGGNYWFRGDSLTGSLYYLDTSNSCPLYYMEKLVDSLQMQMNGTSGGCNSNITVNSIVNISHWGVNGIDKNFYRPGVNGFVSEINRKYNIFFGIIYTSYSFYYSGTGSNNSNNLKGCIIDGIVYGDTVVSDIKEVGNQIPSKFTLGQNYPNPFNPATNIPFELKELSHVTLKVFDARGREVKELVNGRWGTGKFIADFDASALASGIYFYQIIVSGETTRQTFIAVKKLMLLK